ncbi:MAG TPA: hypothetical protein VL326_25675, partial [Kofleriaceae bacterium]|nr:hypothetical protein [Kofleriaceae bacterium]
PNLTNTTSAPASEDTGGPRRKKPISTTFEDTRPLQDRPRKTKEPSGRKAPAPAQDVDAERPAPRKRATGVLVAVMVLLAGVIGVAVFLMMKNREQKPAPSPADNVTMTVSAEPVEVGSAATAGSAAAQQTIEFEDDQVGSGSAAAAAAGTGSGSAHHHHHKRTGEADDESNDVADEPALPPPNKPGAIIVVLEHGSTISIDGKVVAQASQGGRYEVAPGHHAVKIEATDRGPISREVDIDPGGTAFIKIADDKSGGSEAPKPEAPKPADPPPATP